MKLLSPENAKILKEITVNKSCKNYVDERIHSHDERLEEIGHCTIRYLDGLVLVAATFNTRNLGDFAIKNSKFSDVIIIENTLKSAWLCIEQVTQGSNLEQSMSKVNDEGWVEVSIKGKYDSEDLKKGTEKAMITFAKKFKSDSSLPSTRKFWKRFKEEQCIEGLVMLISLDSKEVLKSFEKRYKEMDDFLNANACRLNASFFKSGWDFKESMCVPSSAYKPLQRSDLTDAENQEPLSIDEIEKDAEKTYSDIEVNASNRIIQVDGIDTPCSTTPDLPRENDHLSDSQGEDEEGYDTVNTVRTRSAIRQRENFFAIDSDDRNRAGYSNENMVDQQLQIEENRNRRVPTRKFENLDALPNIRVSQNFKHEKFIWDQADSYFLRKRNAEKCENYQNWTMFKGSY